MKNLQDIRTDYKKNKLDSNSVLLNPLEQMKIWLDNAINSEMLEPTAFVLSTVNSDSKPSSRVLLLKGIDEKGPIFYTNYKSRKGEELANNPNASMLFFWDALERQIRIEGKIEKLTYEESDKYFQTRPYTSRIGAWASKQSAVLNSRFTLLRKVASLMIKYPVHVPLPDFWGGYRLIPEYFEFWQGRESRLHDRIRFIKIEDNWKIDRLSP
mgnify:CR=1 FL=1